MNPEEVEIDAGKVALIYRIHELARQMAGDEEILIEMMALAWKAMVDIPPDEAVLVIEQEGLNRRYYIERRSK